MATADFEHDESFRRLRDLLEKQEPLLPELKEYLVEGKNFPFPVLKHPLVFAVPYIEPMNATYNEQFRVKTDYATKAVAEKQWSRYIFIHERPHRFEALEKIVTDHGDELSAETFWKLFGDCWTDTENMWQMEGTIRFLVELGFSDYASGWKAVMDEGEHKLFNSLPDVLVAYRGYQRHNKNGMSWSLSRWKARWFARRYDHKGVGRVVRAVIDKSTVIGVFTSRDEFEVAVLPEDIIEIKRVVPLRRPPYLQSVHAIAVQEFKLGHNSYHGPQHWEDVERNVVAIAKKTRGADMWVCRLFAILHDCQRQDEDEDKLHGTRSARFVKELHEQHKLGINNDQAAKLMQACVKHTSGEITTDPTIGACWDADRMDLVRVGTLPDPKYFSTEAAKELLWTI